MNSKILIVGSGQLGSRYLQGLVSVSNSLDIFVYDISISSLKIAKERWKQADGDKSHHTISFVDSLENISNQLDLCIVATMANQRLLAVKEVLKYSSVNYWILEKVLVQSLEEIEELSNILESSESVWVNTPMHIWSLYKNLKEKIGTGKMLNFYFEDIRGLACNTIHYIDLVFRWNQNSIQSIDTSGLDTKWYNAERNGFWDIYGNLKVNFSDGSTLLVSSKEKDRDFRVKVLDGSTIWIIDERKGYAENNLGERIEGHCEYQSILTSSLVEFILNGKGCNLPNLKQSSEQHRLYLISLLQHWNKTMPQKTTLLPIT